MSDSIDRLLQEPVSFLACSGPEEDIAISSRIRLARNLTGRPFPAAASAESRQRSAIWCPPRLPNPARWVVPTVSPSTPVK